MHMKRSAICLISLILMTCLGCSKGNSIKESDMCMTAAAPPHSKSAIFQSVIDGYIQEGLPGIALLVKDDEGIWMGAAGKADIAWDIDMQTCHVGKVASLTKIFMAALTFRLAEEGQVDLDKNISEYLSAEDIRGIANADQVTVRQLLNHTTGIYDVIKDNDFYLSVLNDPPAHRDQYDILKFVRGKDPVFSAGTASSYSNTNTLLLSMVIDKATGRSHAQLLREKIFEPLLLTHSFYYYHDPLPDYKVAQGYYDLFNDHTIVNVSSYNTGSGNGYTGVYTTVEDLLTFSEALFEDKTLVNPSSLEQMLTFNPDMEAGADRELGQGTMKDFIHRAAGDEYAYGHRGRDLGYSADMFYFPEKGQTMILIVNYGTDGESALRPSFYALRTRIVDAMMAD